jgi:hypothetical protein
MSKLGGLINGQDVAFDTHQAGDGQSTNWQKVHLEKRLHDNRGKARFPLLGNEKPSSSGMNESDFSRITREVRDTLKKNDALTRSLAETIVDQMRRFSSGEATVEHASLAARAIADAFDLDKEFLRVVQEYAKGRLISFTSIHFNQAQNTLHEIVITKVEIVVQKPRRHNSLRRIDPRR